MAYSFTIEHAERASAKPLIGLYSESGCGKTKSALLLARGFVGPQGTILMIETEGGRGESYADPNEYPELRGPNPKANYKVIRLHEGGDFSPKAYGAAIKAAEVGKVDALIVDSASHEWEASGGVLSMAAANEAAGKKAILVWQQPKIEHSREFMLKFMQTPIPLVILCMRAKYPMEEVFVNGKKSWTRSTKLEPIQSDNILFEMFLHGWIDQEHRFNLTKSTSITLTPVFETGKPITLDTGRKLAQWAKPAPTTAAVAETREPKADKQAAVDAIKRDLMEAAEGGEQVLTVAWERLTPEQRRYLQAYYDDTLLPAAKAADVAT